MPCYDPGVRVGEVKQPYCVIHDAGTKPQERTRGMLGQHIYEIVILVPISDQAQAQLQALCRQVRAALSGVRGLKYTGDAAPTALEVSYNGAAQSLIYRAPEVLINIK